MELLTKNWVKASSRDQTTLNEEWNKRTFILCTKGLRCRDCRPDIAGFAVLAEPGLPRAASGHSWGTMEVFLAATVVVLLALTSAMAEVLVQNRS